MMYATRASRAADGNWRRTNGANANAACACFCTWSARSRVLLLKCAQSLLVYLPLYR